jgi:DNA-binding transcriptional LysR family regulator
MRWRFLFLSLIFFLAGCQNDPAQIPTMPLPTAPPGLRIGVSESASQFADLIAPPLAELLPETAVQFVIANQQTLWADLAAGLLDAIFVHDVPPAADYWFDPVAVDAIVLITHPQNPLSLTSAEAQALFAGDVRNWSALNGPDAPVLLLTREEGAGCDSCLPRG